MKKNFILLLVASVFTISSMAVQAQAYRTSSTEALQNTRGQWIQKKLPPSVITFSDYSGQVNIKAALSSLFTQSQDSLSAGQLESDTMAEFSMNLDKEQIQQQQISSGKTFITTGQLVINTISKKTIAQCQLIPRNNPADGFSISVIIRFNPADFGMKVIGETDNDPLIVKVTSGYVNKQNNY